MISQCSWCKTIPQSCLLAAALIAGYPLEAAAKPYKGAEIFTHDSQLYGKYVVRMRTAKGSGVISNFFTWKEGSELSGMFWEEIDVEVFGKNNGQSLQSNIISGMGTRTTSEQVHNHGFSFGDSYHTFTLEWTPSYVRWLVDGQVIRTTSGGQARQLVSPAQFRFNIWPPNNPGWVGSWSNAILPVQMFVNWVEYYSWNGGGFNSSPTWRDDFNSFDTTRWGTADWTFTENLADFSPSNAVTKNGYLVLAITREGQEGYNGTPPNDGGAATPGGGTTTPGNSSCPDVKTAGQSGNFNTAGAYCFRTQNAVNGWGVSNFDGRTISVTVNGVGAATTSTGGLLPPKGASDYYHFSSSAGSFAWASVYWW